MNNKFKIFLSGGITGLNDEDCKKWRDYITERFLYYCIPDFLIVNQMNHFNPNEETSDSLEKEAMMYDLHHLRTSNIIIVNLDKTDSIGTAQELMLAYELHIPIIGFIKESSLSKIHPWIQTEVGKLFTYTDDSELTDVLDLIVYYVKNYYFIP